MALTGNELVRVTGVTGGVPAGQEETTTTNAIASLAAGGPGGLGVLTLNGATSGTSTITPAAIASGVWTLPNATDTVVGKATTDTLTNKTLTSPVLTTPTLGVATATTVNKVTITQPSSGATLTIPDGVTLNAGAGGTLGTIVTRNLGATGTFITVDSKTVTVTSGIIVSIV